MATAGFDLLGDFRTMMGINANLPGTTVVRVRGALQFNLTAAPGATSGVLLGARVSSIEGLGPASPLPSSSPSEDWMMFDWAPLSMGWAGGSIVGTDIARTRWTSSPSAVSMRLRRRSASGLRRPRRGHVQPLRLGLGAGRPAVSIRDLGRPFA